MHECASECLATHSHVLLSAAKLSSIRYAFLAVLVIWLLWTDYVTYLCNIFSSADVPRENVGKQIR